MGSAYDLLVIGSGPAGQRAAIYASKMRKKVALVEMREVVGGACINTGTILRLQLQIHLRHELPREGKDHHG
jgi:pyruvate/2-oxoglutarate dehydrogenase complex dihydrolipoamide dehydrogenase (E3) component